MAAGHGEDVKDHRGWDLIKRMYHACTWGHIKELEDVIAAGGKVNARTLRGETPLQMACESKFEEGVKLLLSLGASVNTQSPHEMQPIGYAIRSRSGAILSMLLEAGADVDILWAKRADGITPLHLAAMHQYAAGIDMLLSYGARADIEHPKWKKARDISVKHNDEASLTVWDQYGGGQATKAAECAE